MKYRVIKCSSAEISDYVKNFNKRLEKFLNNGWKLHGILNVVVTHNEFVQYHQAIIKEDVEVKKPFTDKNIISIADLNMKSGTNFNKNDFKNEFEYIKALKEQTINSC